MQARYGIGPFLVSAFLAFGCGGKQEDVLTGKVTFDGEPLPNVLVVVKGEGNKSVGGESDGSGNYTVNNPPQGKVLIQVIDPPGKSPGPPRKGLERYSGLKGGIPEVIGPGRVAKDLVLTSKK